MLTRRLVRVFAASPGDVAAEREALSRVVDELNTTLGRTANVVIELLRWETHTWPGFGEDAQDVINRQIAEPSDVFVGVMWKRLGTPTGRAASGTVEEFERAYQQWSTHRRPHLMFYFCRAPVPRNADDLEQVGAVLEFQRSLQARGGFCCEYDDSAQFEQLVRRHLYNEISNLLVQAPTDGDKTAGGILNVPAFSHVVNRSQAGSELDALLDSHPVVAVEGLSGSGKTFLVADVLRRRELTESTLWYDVADSSTLDDAMTLLGSEVHFTGQANLTRAKELLQHLEAHDGRIVIDDFNLAVTGSFDPLLRVREALGTAHRRDAVRRRRGRVRARR